MSTLTAEAFSVSHAAILDGTTGADLADIYGVRSGSLDIDTDSFNNTGDDAILSVWNWFNLATVTIDSGYVPFSLISLLSGGTITSSGTAPADYYTLPLWNQSSLNQPARPVLIRCPSKDSTGAPRSLDFVLYKVQFQPIKFAGPTYKDGLVISYTGQAVMSSVDEKGAALTDPAVGKIVQRPRI